MRSTSHRLVTVLLAAAVLVGASAGPAAAADWTAEPAPNHFGAGRQEYRYTLNPGGRLEDGVVVRNHGTAPLRVALRSTGVGAWVRLDRNDMTIPPGKSAEVPFVFTVPGDAKPGDHVGDIAGIPIHLRVGGALEPSLSVEDVDVRYSDGDATVSYTIRNTGNAILGARQTVSVSGLFGSARAGRIADTAALLPGRTRRVSAPIRDVTAAFRLTATVTLVPLLTDAAGSTAPLAATKVSGHAWTVPWSLLLAVVALCGLVVASASLARRHRTSRAAA